MAKEIFNLVIKAREGTLYKGNVLSLTSFNEQGKFDILAEHANFISLIKSSLVIIEVGGGMREYKISNGLLRARQNNVEVYLGIDSIVSGSLETSANIPQQLPK